MAKAKSKSPHARLVQALKKNVVGTWSRNAMDLVERMDRAREGGTLEQVSGCHLLADTPITAYEAAQLVEIHQELYGSKSKPPYFADVMAAWERNPMYAELTRDAIYEFEFSVEKSPERLSALDAYFPGCLLIDVSAIQWKCGYWDDTVSAVFVYPTYSELDKLPALRYVGIGGKGDAEIWFADLILKGDTLDEARRHTIAADDRHLATKLLDEREREAYESLKDVFDEIDAGRDDLVNLMDRLIGLMLSGAIVPQEAGADGNVRRIALRSRREEEEEERRRQIADDFLLREVAAEFPLAVPRDSAGEEPEAGRVAVPSADRPEAPGPVPAQAEEEQLLREALVQMGERYEQLHERAESDKCIMRIPSLSRHLLTQQPGCCAGCKTSRHRNKEGQTKSHPGSIHQGICKQYAYTVMG